MFYSGKLDYPPVYRLVFRELGPAIGMKTLPAMRSLISRKKGNDHSVGLAAKIIELRVFLPLPKRIEEFRSDPDSQHVSSWKSHQNINRVMLATCLAPDGFLRI